MGAALRAESQKDLEKRQKVDPRGIVLVERFVSHSLSVERGLVGYEKKEIASLESIAEEVNELILSEEENKEVFKHFLKEIRRIESIVRRAINDIPYHLRRLKKLSKQELSRTKGFLRRTHLKAIKQSYIILDELINFQKEHLNQFLIEINPFLKDLKSQKRKVWLEILKLRAFSTNHDQIEKLKEKHRIIKKKIAKINAIKRRAINIEIYVQETKEILNKFEKDIESIMKHKV